jgi:nucleotide-binding universal stress UspA family protein
MKIIYAVDGSPHAEAAAELLKKIPFPADSEVIAASVLEEIPLSARAAEHVAPHVREKIHQERTENANTIVATVCDQLSDQFASVRKAILSGNPADQLTTLAESEGADVVVIGARGLNVLERFLLGSTSEKVLRHAPCSVLVAHLADASRETTRAPGRFRILVAYDGSPASDEAVDSLTRLPLAASTEILLLRVHTMVTAFRQDIKQCLSESWRQEELLAREALETAAKRLEAAGIHQVTTRMDDAGDATSRILSVAEEWQADLILAGNTGKSGLDRFLLGSVCKRLTRHAPCSVWVARTKQIAGA